MSSHAPESWMVLAHLLRPQGRKGELLAELHTNQELLEAPASVFLAASDFAGSRSEARRIELIHLWSPTGRNQGRVVLQFAGVDSISQAELLSGLAVLLPKADRPEPEDGAEYVEDLIGCNIFDGGILVGTLEAIEFSSDPEGHRLVDVAPLLSVLTPQGDEVLIPYVTQFLQTVDIEKREIHMQLPAGLVELNSPPSQS